jgi:CBS domain containing-hemolysin-like protein
MLLLMFGEIFPKTFATKNAEEISLAVAKPYEVLMIFLWPVIFIISIINKLFSSKKNNVETVTDEEIEAFIDM